MFAPFFLFSINCAIICFWDSQVANCFLFVCDSKKSVVNVLWYSVDWIYDIMGDIRIGSDSESIVDEYDYQCAQRDSLTALRVGKRVMMFAQAVRLADEVAGLDRIAYAAELLVRNGYEVTLVTSSFQHWEKKHRDVSDEKYGKLPYNVVFLNEPGYKKNIGFSRIRSHEVLNTEMIRFLRDNGDDYDLFWGQIPPNNIAATISIYASTHNKPFIVDVNDLWPEAMRMVIDVPVVSDLLFHVFVSDARTVYRHASACCATSDEYAKRPDKDRDEPIDKTIVYVGGDIDRFDAGVNANAGFIEKDDNEFWVTYAGTLGKSYDIATLIEAVDLASPIISEKNGKHVKLMVLGDGPDRENLEKIAERHENVEAIFTGYISYESMAAVLYRSDVLVNSLIHGAPQSIVSKIGDYLAAGKPMINTGESKEFRKKVDLEGFGKNVEPGDANALANIIEMLARNDSMRKIMGTKARNVAIREFDRKRSYEKIVTIVDKQLGIR